MAAWNVDQVAERILEITKSPDIAKEFNG